MTWLRIPALLAAPLLIAAEAPPPKDRATPASSPGSWIEYTDYPMNAAREGTEGTTAFRLDVDRLGVPTRCTVTTSSGSAILDTTACDKLMIRARFTPAKDAKGKAVPDTYNGRINWRLPEDDGTIYLPPTPYKSVTTFTVNIDGSTSDCSSTLNGEPVKDDDPCKERVLGYRYTVQEDATGKPMQQKLRMTEIIEKVAE